MKSGIMSILKGSIMLVGAIAIAMQSQIIAGEAGKEFAKGIVDIQMAKMEKEDDYLSSSSIN